MELACSTKMNTWKTFYGLPDSGSAAANDMLSSGKDTSELWQKPIDTTTPVKQEFQDPVDGVTEGEANPAFDASEEVDQDGNPVAQDVPTNTEEDQGQN